MKNVTILFCTILLTAGAVNYLRAEKKIVFEDLIRPSAIAIGPGEKHLYIVAFPVINVYSSRDFKPIKKFGSAGEGPGEFLRFARVHFNNGSILVQSQGKLSYFSPDWKLQKEHKLPIQFNRGFKPFGNRAVAASNTVEEGEDAIYQVITFYDWDQEKIKEIYRKKYYFQIGKNINGIYLPEVDRRSGVRFCLWKNRLYLEPDDGENGTLDIYDAEGKKLYSIRHEFEKIKVTDQHKEATREWFRVNKRRLLDLVKERGWLWWPDYFPAVHELEVTDDQIYMIPYLKKEGKVQLFVFDLKGKLLRHVAAPLSEENIFDFHPFCIKGGKIYQLTENDDEVYELRIDDISALPAFSR